MEFVATITSLLSMGRLEMTHCFRNDTHIDEKWLPFTLAMSFFMNGIYHIIVPIEDEWLHLG